MLLVYNYLNLNFVRRKKIAKTAVFSNNACAKYMNCLVHTSVIVFLHV